MKRTLSFVLALVMVLATFTVFAADYDNHWAKENVDYLAGQGIVTKDEGGNVVMFDKTAGTAKPDAFMIRGEFVAMINSIYRFTEKATGGFKDVLQNNPYYQQFLIAKKQGYITGNENREAKPMDSITRAEVAVILARLNSLENGTKAYPETDVPAWAQGAVGALEVAGIMMGNDKGEFMGYSNVTNAEAYTMGARVVKSLPERGPNIYMIGDSTMEPYDAGRKPQTGWGETLQNYLLSNVKVYNHAIGGRSTKSFIDENRWTPILEKLQEGDFVIIQFGHNDQKTDEKLHTDPDTTYKEYLRKYVIETRTKGAIPIICTSVHRCYFDSNGKIKNSLGKYPQAARELAAEMDVICIDLNKRTEDFFNEVGPEGAKDYFLFLDPGESENFPDGKSDSSHFQTKGAEKISEMFAEEILKTESPLKKWVDTTKVTTKQ